MMRRQHRRGNAATLLSSLFTLLGVTAFVVDVGFLYASETQLQASMDAAALAGVGYYDRTPEGVALALEKAVEFAAANRVMGAPPVVEVEALTTGFIENGAFVVSNDPTLITAMRVDHTKVDIQAFFSTLAFGRETLSARAVSIAVQSPGGPAGRVECFLPVAVPDCVLDDPSGVQDLNLRLSSSNADNAGWADPNGNPTPGSINNNLLGQCDGGPIQVGDDIFLNNGVISSSLSQLESILNGNSSAETSGWDGGLWGSLPSQMPGSTVLSPNYGQNVIAGPIAVFDGGGGDCLDGVQFNQTKPITGFVWGVIYDVDAHGQGKNIRVKLDLTNSYDVGSGGGGLDDANVTAAGSGGLVF